MSKDHAGSFAYTNPGRIYWGAGCLEQRLSDELERLAPHRVFVITTRSVAANPDLIGRVTAALGARCAGVFPAIGQHAPAASVAAAVVAAREARADALVSVGGGSPIDAAKAVAFALATGLDLAQPDAATLARSMRPDHMLPQLAIPTTLSAAELSGLAGFTTDDALEKVGLRSPGLVPAAVIFDAELSRHTPLQLWLSTGIRAVDHAVETVLAAGAHPFADTLALEALRRLARSLRATFADPSDLAARTESQLGAWFSFTLPGPAASGLSHTLGKRIGSRHAIPHGVSSCLLLPHVMRYLAPRQPAALAHVARALGARLDGLSEAQAALAAADAVAQLIADLELPAHLAEFGLTDADLERAAEPVASSEDSLDDLVGIYRAAW